MAIFGYNSIGALSDSIPIGYAILGRVFCPETADVTKITAYVVSRYTAGPAKCKLYSNTGALIAESNEATIPTTAGWRDFPFASAIRLQRGYYWLMFHSSVESSFNYTSGEPDQLAVVWGLLAEEFGAYPYNLPNFLEGYGATYLPWMFSIYATYTPIVMRTVTVNSTPVTGVQVTVNGTYVGVTPTSIQVNDGATPTIQVPSEITV